MESAEKVTKIAKLIAENKKIIVFTGAGISTESGIPDFRGPDGLWKKFDPEDFTYDRFVNNKEARNASGGRKVHAVLVSLSNRYQTS